MKAAVHRPHAQAYRQLTLGDNGGACTAHASGAVGPELSEIRFNLIFGKRLQSFILVDGETCTLRVRMASSSTLQRPGPASYAHSTFEHQASRATEL